MKRLDTLSLLATNQEALKLLIEYFEELHAGRQEDLQRFAIAALSDESIRPNALRNAGAVMELDGIIQTLKSYIDTGAN